MVAPTPARCPLARCALLASWLLGMPGCEEYGARVYTARAYRAEEACVEPYVAIGVVQAGELAANCAPQCLLLDDALFVSVVCAPYPPRAVPVAPETSEECSAALQLLQSETICDSPADSGAAGGGLDADADAGVDAAGAGLLDARAP